MKLNRTQTEAVRHGSGPALIIAGPGSGKTAVVTCRIQYLIGHLHVPAEEILAVTFSKKAAQNMKDRFLSLHSGKGTPFFGTFHSIFFMILRCAYDLTAASIVSETKKRELVTFAADQLGIEYEDRQNFAENLLNEFSKVKSGSADAESFVSSELPACDFRKLLGLYSSLLSGEGLIDFDDMLSMCLKLLTERQDILTYWQKRFRYILVDEFQDINPVQYRILRLLSGPTDNLFVVGDDDQCIYSFRGSSPKIMHIFLNDYPKAARIVLNQSYRCPPPILTCAGKVIRENRSRLPKKTESGKTVRFGIFQIRRSKTQTEEYESIAKDIAQRISAGCVPSDFAILTRTGLNHPLLIRSLNDHGIKAASASQPSAYQDHFIVNDINAYIRLSENYTLGNGSSARIREDLSRIINKPSRFISKKELQKAFLMADESRSDSKPTLKDILWELKHCVKKDRRKSEEIRRLEYHLQMLGKCTPYGKLQYICSA